MNARFNNVGQLLSLARLVQPTTLLTSDTDLIGVATFEQVLGQHHDSFIAETEREISIMMQSCCHDISLNMPMILNVQDIRPFSNLRFHHGSTQTIRTMGYNFYSDLHEPDSYVAILPDSMPTLEDIHKYNLDADHNCDSGPFAGLNIAFGKFGERYCSLGAALPLVSCMVFIVRCPSIV